MGCSCNDFSCFVCFSSKIFDMAFTINGKVLTDSIDGTIQEIVFYNCTCISLLNGHENGCPYPKRIGEKNE